MAKDKSGLRYIMKKIAHLKRMGLISEQKSGFGVHSGACPDWLREEQEELRKKGKF